MTVVASPTDIRAGLSEKTLFRFSVVIPTYQRRDLVMASVRALAKQMFERPFEVVVVVDGSTDGSAQALAELKSKVPLTIIKQPNRGLSAARNRGAAGARGQFLLFLDDDMEADPNLLTEHERSHQEGAEVVMGHIPLHPASPTNFLTEGIKWWADDRLRILSEPDANLSLHDLLGGQMSLSRQLFHRMGGFDTHFTLGGTFGNEDIDFGYRLVKAGCRIVFNPLAISWQNYIVDAGDFLRRRRQAGSADVVFARKHPEQAKTLFALNGSEKRSSRWLWRPLVAMTPVSAPLMMLYRWLILIVVSRFDQPLFVKLFYEIWTMEYWRGVADAGGVPKPRAIRVLAYHTIRSLPESPAKPYGMPLYLFRRQLNALQKLGFNFISGHEFLEFLKGGGLPRQPVLLTFDDGYQELSATVLPLLKERGIPAVAFVVSGLVGSTNEWDRDFGAPSLRLVGKRDLRRLPLEGIEIGAHSRTHKCLPELSDDELEQEVTGSVSDLEAVLSCRPRMFAYPGGDHNKNVQEAVKNAGLQAAFTVVAGRMQKFRDHFLVPRIEILRQDVGWRFLWKVIVAGRL